MPEQPAIDALLEEALELKWFLPVLVDAQAAPLVWADPAHRQDLLALPERAHALGAHLSSRSLLLHFSAVPDWVPQLPPRSLGRSRHGGHEEDVLQLVRTSIPVGFAADAMTRLQKMLDQLPGTRL
jgi:predicted ATPase